MSTYTFRRFLLLAAASAAFALPGLAGPAATATVTQAAYDGGSSAHPVSRDIDLYVAERKSAWAQDKVLRPWLYF